MINEFTIPGSVQPIQDDFSTDGELNEFARIDHQHALSSILLARIKNWTFGTVALRDAAISKIKKGDTAWVDSTGNLYLWTGVSWIPIGYVPARYFTAANTVIGAGLTVAIPFVDNFNKSQGGIIGNSVAGQATFSEQGIYTVSVQLAWNISYSINNGIALYNNGTVVGTQVAFGPFGFSSATFTFIQKPGDAAATLTVNVYNATGVSLTVVNSQIIIMQNTVIIWT